MSKEGTFGANQVIGIVPANNVRSGARTLEETITSIVSGHTQTPVIQLHSKLSDTGLQAEIDQLSSGAEEMEEELYDEEVDDES